METETEPTTTWRQKQRLVREEAILDAAREMIAENGYEAMTMEDLAERVGISKPTLYQHFSSKEVLAVRAVVVQMERTLQAMREPIGNRTAWQRLADIVRQLVTQRFSCTHFLHGNSKVALTPIVRPYPEYQNARRQMIGTLDEIVDAAKAEGAIAKNLTNRVLIQMLFSMVRDSEYDELIKNGDCTEDEVHETLIAIFLNGLNKTNP